VELEALAAFGYYIPIAVLTISCEIEYMSSYHGKNEREKAESRLKPLNCFDDFACVKVNRRNYLCYCTCFVLKNVNWWYVVCYRNLM
jgi:hypothetical protein